MRKAVKKPNIPLTEADRQILDSYCALAPCLGTFLGGAYELVVHSLGEGDSFTLKIVNSIYSSRSPEDTITDAASGAVEHLQQRLKHGDQPISVSFGLGPDGKMYKSSSTAIVGTGNRMIGMFCVNCCLDAPFSEIVKNFTLPTYLESASLPIPVSDSSRYDAVLRQSILKVRDAVMSDETIPAKFKRKQIVRQLSDAGVFKVKNSIQICADTLGITIATIYMHLRNLDS